MKYKIEQCFGTRIRRLSRIVDGHYRSCLKDFDITEHQMTLLFALKKLGTIDQGVLGKKLFLERSSISRSINGLYKKGYVDKSNEYRPYVFLSQKGIKLVKKLLPLWENVMDNISSEIGEDGMKSITKLEQKLR